MIIPSNTIPYFLGSIASLVFGIKSTQSYLKLKSPLSKHFAISGYLAALGLGLYSVPFYLTSNPDILKMCMIMGKLFIDLAAYWQIYLIWYLTELKKFPLMYFIVPLVMIGSVGYFQQVIHIQNSAVGVVDGVAIYPLAGFYRYTHIFSLLIVFVAGVILATKAFEQTETRSRMRLLSISTLYIFASLADIYSAVFLKGLNDSWVVLVGFVIATGVFLLATIILTKK